jgi:hypothetical protein
MIAKRGHDMVHDRFCVELMVNSIETIYDEVVLRMRSSEGVAR